MTILQGAEKMLIVGAACEDNNHRKCDFADGTASFGASPLELAATRKSDADAWMNSSALWYLLDPGIDVECGGVYPCTRVVTVDPGSRASAPDNLHGGAFVVTGVAQQPPVAVATQGSEPCQDDLSMSITVPTAGAWVADIGSTGTFAPHGEPGPDQTTLWTNLCVSSTSQATVKALETAGETTMTINHSRPKRCSHVLMAIAPASALQSCNENADCGAVSTHGETPIDIEIDPASVASECEPANSAELSFDVTVAGGDDRLLVVGAGCEDGTHRKCDFVNATATFGGSPLWLASANESDTVSWVSVAALWYMLESEIDAECGGVYPCTRAVTVTPGIGSSAPDNLHGGAFVLTGTAQEGPEAVTNDGGDRCAGGLSTTIETTSDRAWVIDVGASGENNGTGPPGSGQVARWTNACLSSSSQATTKAVASAGPTTSSVNHIDPNRCSHVLMSIAPRR